MTTRTLPAPGEVQSGVNALLDADSDAAAEEALNSIGLSREALTRMLGPLVPLEPPQEKDPRTPEEIIADIQRIVDSIPASKENPMNTNTANPENPNQYHCWYDAIASHLDENENRHPQVVVRELAQAHGFQVLNCVPQSIADGWSFWIEVEGELPAFPSFFKPKGWIPVGQV